MLRRLISVLLITWTVAPGGPFTAKAERPELADTTTGSVLTCESSSLAGTLKAGKGLPGRKIGKITKLTFTHCGSPLGIVFTVTPQLLPWYLDAVRFNAVKGITTGFITGIDVTMSGPSCTFDFDGTAAGAGDGTVKFTYTNATGRLKIIPGGSLTIYNVSGCAGLFNNGDRMDMPASYTVAPRQRIT